MPAKEKDKSYEEEVERSIVDMLKLTSLTNEEKIKIRNVAVRWAAVKAKIVLREHGSGFDDEGDD